MKCCVFGIILYAATISFVSSQSPHGNQPRTGTTGRTTDLCARLAEVRVLPFKDESVDDPVYNGLVSLGRNAVPCLIGEITNTKLTHDPRKAPHYGNVKVGDVAFWILGRIVTLRYDKLFPQDVSKRFADEGVYAYFDWINKPGHRTLLQQNIKSYVAHENAFKQPGDKKQ